MHRNLNVHSHVLYKINNKMNVKVAIATNNTKVFCYVSKYFTKVQYGFISNYETH